jgi:hypothetical protein
MRADNPQMDRKAENFGALTSATNLEGGVVVVVDEGWITMSLLTAYKTTML